MWVMTVGFRLMPLFERVVYALVNSRRETSLVPSASDGTGSVYDVFRHIVPVEQLALGPRGAGVLDEFHDAIDESLEFKRSRYGCGRHNEELPDLVSESSRHAT